MYRSELGGLRMYGRRSECDRLEQMLTDIRTGQSRVLVLRGDAGIGKTALLDHMSRHASGCRVARATGVESEMELPFAGLHQLCAPFLDRLGRLPPPQREALSVVFGLLEGNAPDRFFIGLAVLSLVSDAAEERPLVCLVDDAQWLDQASAQTLAFVARRLFAESVALVFATRDSGDDPALRRLPDLRVEGLSDVDACAVLRTALRSPLDPAVLDEIVAEARGNPLALLELPRGRTPAEIAFGFGLPSTLPLVSRMEQGFLRQLQPLPPETRKLLIIAAVEPVGDAPLVWRAAERLGIGADAAAPAAAAGLIDIRSRVRFRHPLLRSAVFHAAELGELKDVHAALAAVPGLDPDRRAWHRAQASPGPDEEIATELDRSADRARARRSHGGSGLPRAGDDADARPGPSGDAGTGRGAGQAPLLTTRHVRVARDTGALSELPIALNSRIVALVLSGEPVAAAALVEEERAVREATGSNVSPYGAMVHAALQGRETPARELIDATLREIMQRGEGIGAMVAHWATALLLNGLGRYEEAQPPARRASEYPLELCPSNWGLIELIEAAVRSGETRVAGDAFERLTETTGAAGTDWALGVESRSRALLGSGDADELHRQAIDHLGRTGMKLELARTHLLYGEWLRREGRRIDAREHLRAAHDQFTAMGAEGFGERVRRELVAAGEPARTRAPDAREELTAQETEIARLAALRWTNQEIGAQLFLSPRTVEWHLRKVFMKLGVSSRKELFDALPEGVRVSVPG